MKIYFVCFCFTILSCIKVEANNPNSFSCPPPPVITLQPKNASICDAGLAPFGVATSDPKATFKWQEDKGSGFVNLTKNGLYRNVDSATMYLVGVTGSMNNYKYRCVVTNSSGSVFSDPATLTVIVTVIINTQPPKNTNVCNGENITIDVTATAANPVYQWRWSTASGWADLHDGSYYSGTNTSTLKLTGVSNKNPPVGTYIFYTCTITSGACSLTTTLAILTINTVPPINSQPLNDSVCLGNNSTFLTSSQGAGLTYKWQEDKGSGFASLSDAGIYSGTSTKQITLVGVTQPMSGYKYKCTVTNMCGTTASNPATLVVNSNPLITSQPATSVTVCNGGSISFGPHVTGTNLNYQWQATTGSGFFDLPNSSFYVNAKTSSLKLSAISNQAPPAGVYTLYKCKIYAAGCPAITSGNVNVNITPSVPASVSITASSKITCPGIPVNFIATPVNGGSKPTFQWKLNGGPIGSNKSTFSSSTLNNGDKVSCTMISNDSCSAGSPFVSEQIQISVVANPPASLTITASSKTICSGEKVDFTAIAGNGGDAPAFQWKLNNQPIVGFNSPFYNNSNLKNGDSINCKMTSSANCVTGSPFTSKAIFISVVQNLPASVEISASDTTVCTGSLISFSATPTNGGSKPVYQWKINGQAFDKDSSASSFNQWMEGDLVTVTMTSNSSCVSGPPVVSKPKKIHLKTAVTASVFINTLSKSICPGATAIFTASPINGGKTPVYQWRINSKNAGQDFEIFSADNLNTGDTVSVIMFSSDCVLNESTASVEPVILTAGNPANAGNIKSTSYEICAGKDAANLFATGNSGKVQWQFSPNSSGFDDIPGATNSSYLAKDLVKTTFYRMVVSNGSCFDTSNIIKINVFSPLFSRFVWNKPDNEVSFNSGTSTGDIVKYVWTFGDGDGDSTAFPVHTYAKDATYHVCLTVQDSSKCSDINCQDILLKGTNVFDISPQSRIKIYPNPFGNFIFISHEQSDEQIESVEIFDLLGRKIMVKDVSDTEEKTFMLDVSAISHGMYFLKVKTSETNYIHAVIKQ